MNPKRLLLLAILELALEHAREEVGDDDHELVRLLGMALVAAAHLEGDEGENEPGTESVEGAPV